MSGHQHQSAPLFFGIDVGTSGVRAIAIDDDNNICAQAAIPLPDPINSDGAIEQAPQLWWSALCDVIKQLSSKIDAQQIKALCLDGTSGTVLLADKNGAPVSPGLMYNDARAAGYLDTIAQHAPTDCAVHSATSGLAKLLWLKGQSYAKHSRYFCHQADWLVGKLTGQFNVSDVNNCLKTGYDPVNKSWPAWLDQLAVKRDWLPQVTTPGSMIATIKPDIAELLGLSQATQVLSGTTDSTAAIMATGARQPGEAITSLGSTLVLKVIAEQPVVNMAFGVYSQPFGDYWLVGGSSNSGGAVLRYFFSDRQMRAMESQLDASHSTGLDYYPLLQPGERFPHNDLHWPARLTPRPENDVVFFQGLLEGLTQIELEGYQLLQQLGAPYPKTIYSVGGGSVNQAWRRMRQQQLGVSIKVPAHSEAAYGMALLAQHGCEATS